MLPKLAYLKLKHAYTSTHKSSTNVKISANVYDNTAKLFLIHRYQSNGDRR
jgi:hypothetical protein